MATAAQLTANRANAARSTGPVTTEGKASSSRNSFKHGLTSADLCVAPEHQDEFDAFKSALLADLNPGSAIEFVLFNQTLSASWRLLRCDRTEAALLGTIGADPLLSTAHLATLNTINKVRSQATGQLHKALAELRTIQTQVEFRRAAITASSATAPASADQPDLPGLADWQSIRHAFKRERALDETHLTRQWQREQKNEPSDAELDQQFDEFYDRFYATYGSILSGHNESGAAKTNPIAKSNAA